MFFSTTTGSKKKLCNAIFFSVTVKTVPNWSQNWSLISDWKKLKLKNNYWTSLIIKRNANNSGNWIDFIITILDFISCWELNLLNPSSKKQNETNRSDNTFPVNPSTVIDSHIVVQYKRTWNPLTVLWSLGTKRLGYETTDILIEWVRNDLGTKRPTFSGPCSSLTYAMDSMTMKYEWLLNVERKLNTLRKFKWTLLR